MDDQNQSTNYQKMYPGFTVLCNKCGSKNVQIDNTLGYSAASGSWGSVDFLCDECGSRVEIVES